MAGLRVSNLVFSQKTQVLAANYSVLATDPSVLYFDPTEAPFTVTLPVPSTVTGQQFTIGNIGSTGVLSVFDGENVLTSIDPNTENAIHSASFVSTGTAWVVVNQRGAQGLPGAQGIQGEPGVKGDPGDSGTGESTIVSGIESIANTTDVVSVVFETERTDTNYVVGYAIVNTVDETPNAFASVLTEKDITGFTVKLSAPTNSANYKLDWLIK